MFANKGVTAVLSTITFTLSSSFAYAAESSNASFAGWPILALVAVVLVFRKKIFTGATIQEPKTETKKQGETKKSSKKPTPPAQKKTTKKVSSTKAQTKSKEKSNSGAIDLTDEGKQCQAATAKGTQCKRTNTLEKKSIEIDGTTYQLTVCSQHNNDLLKPYSKLIKK